MSSILRQCVRPSLRNVFSNILRVILESSTTKIRYTGPWGGSCSFWDCFCDLREGAADGDNGAGADNGAGDGEEVTTVIAAGRSCCDGASAA